LMIERGPEEGEAVGRFSTVGVNLREKTLKWQERDVPGKLCRGLHLKEGGGGKKLFNRWQGERL